MARPIMIQGTMSAAGKSLICAGLCRIFVQDGYRTAPFKSQNMALNSFVTDEGLEMGRAQVVQAQAARTKPDAAMNPILLKPTTDTGSQVIVNGRVLCDMSAREYFKYKKKLIPDIMRAYNKLSSEYDIIVIEGAGSPAEINLKADDIVNMGMAKMADAPVLLVGDIDRGGVFAQLVGTVMLLEEDERDRIKGLIINKFRGDKTILDPGIEMLTRLCGREVVGVVPYFDTDIDDEDSLTERFSSYNTPGLIDIAVIRLPRISNFTDLGNLECINGVSLRYITKPSELKHPDMIVIPGSKSTVSDLLWMRQCGLEAAVKKAAAAGCCIFGICGGYQMLGLSIAYADRTGDKKEVSGMGLLPVRTIFRDEKILRRVSGRFSDIGGILKNLSHKAYSGYEIHMGETFPEEGARPLGMLCNEEGGDHSFLRADGACRDNVYGTYVHGIYDGRETADTVIRALAENKGIDPGSIKAADRGDYMQEQYDTLADVLRNNLDMDRIYSIIGLK